jgi:hypothetical protein
MDKLFIGLAIYFMFLLAIVGTFLVVSICWMIYKEHFKSKKG